MYIWTVQLQIIVIYFSFEKLKFFYINNCCVHTHDQKRKFSVLYRKTVNEDLQRAKTIQMLSYLQLVILCISKKFIKLSL